MKALVRFVCASSLLSIAALVPTAGRAQVGMGQPVATAQAQSPASTDAARSGPAQSGASPASMPNYKLAPDDSIQITVWKEKDISGTFPVRPDGKISLVLLGDIQAAGLTPEELSNVLTEKLKKYIQDPLVTVSVLATNSQKVFVLGEVQKVGPVEMSADMTALQAISAAGGLTPYASESHVYILRGPAGHQNKILFNYKKALKGDPNASVALKAGDTIVVP
jgi:polysaccharide export outer membrane protein